MNIVDDGALRMIHDGGARGVSEALLLRAFPVEDVSELEIRGGLADLAKAGFIQRTIKTRTGGWVYVATNAGLDELNR